MFSNTIKIQKIKENQKFTEKENLVSKRTPNISIETKRTPNISIITKKTPNISVNNEKNPNLLINNKKPVSKIAKKTPNASFITTSRRTDAKKKDIAELKWENINYTLKYNKKKKKY